MSMSNAVLSIPSPAGGPLAAPCLTVRLRHSGDGAVIAREPVIADDLIDARAETWREGYLRRGHPGCRLDDLSPWILPLPSADDPTRLTGFAIATQPDVDGASSFRHEFSALALEAVARRAELRLIATGVLKAGHKYVYELEAASQPAVPTGDAADAAESDLFEVTVNNPPLQFLSVPLAPLRKRAEVAGDGSDDAFPVFFLSHALANAEQFSRAGAARHTRHESGAVLTGFLCVCPDSGEFFVIVADAFEVTDASASLVTLEYTGESWRRIETVVRARQLAEPALRIVGQAHGHNFLPNNGVTCTDCPNKAVCNVTNLFASSEDNAWHRAVFARQPWSLCQIFGLTARGDHVRGMFTLHDGHFQQRPFFVLPDLAVADFPVLTVPQ
jgi:hypothetical protein